MSLIASELDKLDKDVGDDVSYHNLKLIASLMQERKQLEWALEFCSVF